MREDDGDDERRKAGIYTPSRRPIASVDDQNELVTVVNSKSKSILRHRKTDPCLMGATWHSLALSHPKAYA